jgi:hypothetical protein
MLAVAAAFLAVSSVAPSAQAALPAHHGQRATATGSEPYAKDSPLVAVVTRTIPLTKDVLSVKEGSLRAGWNNMYRGVSKIAIATDPVHGPLIALLTSSGAVFARQGSLTSRWYGEGHGVTQIAAATDTKNGPIIGIVTITGEVLVKEGRLTAAAPWVVEYSKGAKGVSVASDPKHGPLVVVLTDSGKVLAKEGSLLAPFTDVFNGAAQVDIASDTAAGPLMGIITSGGDLLVRTGLSGPWTEEYSHARQVAVAEDDKHGPLIAVLGATGQVYAKEGSLAARWIQEYAAGAEEIDVASSATLGPLISLHTRADAMARIGSLRGSWQHESGDVLHIAVTE